MVVDDEPDILAIIVGAMQKYQFPIEDFTNPVKALAHFEHYAGDYALVLSDIRIPGMSGLEFLNFVKRVRPDIPIMAMTAYSASGEDIAKAVPWIKKEEIMHKPFKALEICAAVKKTLKITV
jgi:DNA-binding NtrC family response regulator